jgi:hypothetical protein
MTELGDKQIPQRRNPREGARRVIPLWESVLAEMQDVAPEELKSVFDKQIPRADLELESARRSGENSVVAADGRIIASRTNYHRTESTYSIIALTFRPTFLTEEGPERSLVVTMPNPDALQGDVVYKRFEKEESKGAEFRPEVDREFGRLKEEFLKVIKDAAITIRH